MMNSTGGTPMIVPRLTWNPELPRRTTDALRDAPPAALRGPGGFPSLALFTLPRYPTRFAIGAVVALFPAPLPVVEPLRDALFVGLGVWLAGGIAARVRGWRGGRLIRRSRNDYVLDTDLIPEAGQLLARFVRASGAIMRSKVHAADLLDSQRNKVVIPAQQWELATALREYSRIVRQEPERSKAGGAVSGLLDARSAALAASLAGCERRVVALEEYAAQTAEADRQYQEMQQVQQIAAQSEDILNLLASTARDDLAVAEIQGIAGEAAALAEVFSATVEKARGAAVLALPRAS
ncbi:hypothetical protein ACIQGT_13905 [Streptomyces sp. NPDC093108]|uniref:hypothetical protein n=1 Tax=unclassified Streptomyces TaxID=2593676 RepID=UPI0037FBF95A